MSDFVHRQFAKRPILTIFVVALGGIVIASATGVLSAPTRLLSKAWGTGLAWGKNLFGMNKRAA